MKKIFLNVSDFLKSLQKNNEEKKDEPDKNVEKLVKKLEDKLNNINDKMDHLTSKIGNIKHVEPSNKTDKILNNEDEKFILPDIDVNCSSLGNSNEQ